MDRARPAGGSGAGRGLAAVALGLVPVLVAGGAALAFTARRERAAVVATADTAAAMAAATLDARIELLRARLETLAADADALTAGGAERLVQAITEEPAFGALHRVGDDGTALAATPPIAELDRRGLHLSVPVSSAPGERLVATVVSDVILEPLEARLTGTGEQGTAVLPPGTRVRLVPAEGAEPPAEDGAIVAERPVGADGWLVRVEVPRAAVAAAARFRLGAGLLGLAAAAAAGVAFAAALLGRRRGARDAAREVVAEQEPAKAEAAATSAAEAPVLLEESELATPGKPARAEAAGISPLGDDHAVTIRALLHDLSTALTLAGNDARRLAEGEVGALDSLQAGLVRQLAARIDGMMRLVRAVLADSAAAEPGVPAGGAALNRAPASLVTLAALATEAAARTAEGRGITVVLEPSEPEDGLLVGYWDSDSLGRVVANLLDNAIKYTPAGGTVRVSVRRDGRGALLTVADTGAGLVPEEVEAVFEAGRRGHAAARLGAPGLGIGLATCRAIVAAHGGRIWLESHGPDRGTTAAMRLPLDRRRAPRGHGRWPARVDWGGGQELSATVETLSRSGAAVRVSVAPPVGALVALRIGGLPSGEVRGEPGVTADDEVAAIGRVVRVLEAGHAGDSEGRPAGAPDARAPLAAIAFAEVGPGTGARLERAVAAAVPDRARGMPSAG